MQDLLSPLSLSPILLFDLPFLPLLIAAKALRATTQPRENSAALLGRHRQRDWGVPVVGSPPEVFHQTQFVSKSCTEASCGLEITVLEGHPQIIKCG